MKYTVEYKDRYTENYFGEKLTVTVAHLLMKGKMKPNHDVRLWNNSM